MTMKWIYGKNDFKTMERGNENCYLLTNGLGGYSSLTMNGGVARNDHAVLMACVKAPNHRYNIIHRFRELLWLDKKKLCLSSQEFDNGKKEEGYVNLSTFIFEEGPVWRFHAEGAEIVKELGIKQGENTIAVTYRIRNRSTKTAELQVTPFFQFCKKGGCPYKNQVFYRRDGVIGSEGMELFFETNGTVEEIEEEWETYFYSYDACDGRDESGMARADHQISIKAKPGKTIRLDLVYSMENAKQNAEKIIRDMKMYRKSLEKTAGFTDSVAAELAKSAHQFIARRDSTGGKTILAGYPFFEDWGRDTMIALPGICICTGQHEAAKEILKTFAVHERNGLMPNLFPEGGNEPLYNTADAALLFINGVYLYYKAVPDREFLKEMYPVMERITEHYWKGTEYGIRMDRDGLLLAGEGLWQVTWMDVRVGDILPTPRHGKPVEINAYWYNALSIMDELAEDVDREPCYVSLRQKVKESFRQKFWMEEKHCLKDLISGTEADYQIRCNQIWAVSMPYTMLDSEKERQVVETVFEKLYTPLGLRTLDREDREFHPFYGGRMEERDMAYHQGTVWTFPLGAYYLSYLKVNDNSQEAKETVRGQLEAMESAVREGCIGQLPEIYDGQNPDRSKGCFAQAWSVGEMLRVYKALENEDSFERSGK